MAHAGVQVGWGVSDLVPERIWHPAQAEAGLRGLWVLQQVCTS